MLIYLKKSNKYYSFKKKMSFNDRFPISFIYTVHTLSCLEISKLWYHSFLKIKEFLEPVLRSRLEIQLNLYKREFL